MRVVDRPQLPALRRRSRRRPAAAPCRRAGRSPGSRRRSSSGRPSPARRRRPRSRRSTRSGTRGAPAPRSPCTKTPSSSAQSVLPWCSLACGARSPPPLQVQMLPVGSVIPRAGPGHGRSAPLEPSVDELRSRDGHGSGSSAASRAAPSGSRVAISSPPLVCASASRSCSGCVQLPQSVVGVTDAWLRWVPPATTPLRARSSTPSSSGTAPASSRRPRRPRPAASSVQVPEQAEPGDVGRGVGARPRIMAAAASAVRAWSSGRRAVCELLVGGHPALDRRRDHPQPERLREEQRVAGARAVEFARMLVAGRRSRARPCRTSARGR